MKQCTIFRVHHQYLLDLNAIDLDERKLEKKTDNETNHAHHKHNAVRKRHSLISQEKTKQNYTQTIKFIDNSEYKILIYRRLYGDTFGLKFQNVHQKKRQNVDALR